MSTPQQAAIIPPQEGWEEDTLYLVKVAYNSNNIIHEAYLKVGFLNGPNATPGGYSEIWDSNYDHAMPFRKAYYLKVIKKLHQEQEEETTIEMTNEAAPDETCSEAAGRLEALVIPPEVLDLVRFMCATWTEIDRFVYQHCDGEALMRYPVVQGTGNQIRLQRIGEQPHNTANIHKAVEWMQRYNGLLERPAENEAAGY